MGQTAGKLVPDEKSFFIGLAAGATALGAVAYMQTRNKFVGEEKAATELVESIDWTGGNLYEEDGPIAREIASVTPYYPFKGIDRFYDIGGFLKHPAVFQKAVDAIVERYRGQQIDSIGAFDARGFILAPPVALALNLPLFMLRKKGKMPNAVSGSQYTKEYASKEGDDVLCIQRGAVEKGDRVLLIDDLVATGGTLLAGIELVKGFGGNVVECACVVELTQLNARARFVKEGHGDIPIWGLISEKVLNLKGELPAGYVDDGEGH